MTFTAKYTNGTAFAAGGLFTFDAINAILYIAPSANTFIGNYSITYSAVVTSSTTYKNSTSFIV